MWKRVRAWVSKQRPIPVLALGSSLLVSAGLIAKGVERLREREPDRSAQVSPPRPSAPPLPPASVQQVAEGVLTRNIFDSTTGAIPWVDPVQLPAAQEADAGVEPLTASGPCGDEVRLFASIVNGRDPERSIAALRKDGKTHLVPLGGALGDLTLTALFPTHAYLRRQTGTSCYLRVYATGNQPPPPEPPPPPPPEPPKDDAAARPGRKPPAFSEEELRRNIRVLGPQSYAITKELFLRARQNPSGISRGARFTSRVVEGRPAGMQISRIRDDSLLAHLGLKQGDVVRRLNGFNLGSADGVLEAFGHLSKIDKVSLTIERDGQPQTIRYQLE